MAFSLKPPRDLPEGLTKASPRVVKLGRYRFGYLDHSECTVSQALWLHSRGFPGNDATEWQKRQFKRTLKCGGDLISYFRGLSGQRFFIWTNKKRWLTRIEPLN